MNNEPIAVRYIRTNVTGYAQTADIARQKDICDKVAGLHGLHHRHLRGHLRPGHAGDGPPPRRRHQGGNRPRLRRRHLAHLSGCDRRAGRPAGRRVRK